MKILLINSPNEVDKSLENANYSLFPHMGIVQLATRLANDFGNRINIEVIDGGIKPLSEIKQKILSFKPSLVGISVLTPTYGEGLKIASFAKKNNATIVLGNDHAIFFPKEILNNRAYIDYIITNDVAEQPFSDLVSCIINKTSFHKVDSLAYRLNGKILINPTKQYFLKNMNTIPDLNFIKNDLETYSNKYYSQHGHIHGKEVNVMTVNNARGCENQLRCSYCSIADLRVNTGDPIKFWDTIINYHEQYNINLFFEVYDSFTASPRYINSLLQTMPNYIKRRIDNGDIEFMIYARTLGLLARDNVNKFKELGVRRVNIGLDSGDSDILEAQRKNKTTDRTNIDALKLLNKADMSVHGSFMLGAAGETTSTVEKTILHIKEIMELVEFSSIEISRLYPLPNSPIWDMLVDYLNPNFYKNSEEIDSVLGKLGLFIPIEKHMDLSQKYKGTDLFNKEELMSDWYNNFTHIDEEFAISEIKRIDDLIQFQNIQTGNNVG
ncbi:B12-binding domain-containing radical SAM protein [Tenacibaculum finnmarkense]|uniref:B12-binding domain-containing radical SAM protein n=1 Tax=Tenacibaculum finnmarkense TaxID=2781243 RepID=UPI0023017F39|nr:radical SAM protein [Tenacibaculum finnmarkense]WCC46196.1 radical SAM protein [Tenacibaculum finnmarkense]